MKELQIKNKGDHDHLGTTRYITNENGEILHATDTLAYGEELTAPYENEKDEVMNTITYTGHEKDYETDLTYMLARYYSQGYGRFLSPDPGYDYDQLDPMSWNLYSYVRGNPVKNVDKTGKIVGTVCGAISGGLIEGFNNRDKEGGFWRGFKKGAIAGAITGAYIDVAAATGGLSLLGSAAFVGLGGAFGSVVATEVDSVQYEKRVANSKEILASAGVGFASGFLSEFGGRMIAKGFGKYLTNKTASISVKQKEKALDFIELTTKMELNGKTFQEGWLEKGTETILKDGLQDANSVKATISFSQNLTKKVFDDSKDYLFSKSLDTILDDDKNKNK